MCSLAKPKKVSRQTSQMQHAKQYCSYTNADGFSTFVETARADVIVVAKLQQKHKKTFKVLLYIKTCGFNNCTNKLYPRRYGQLFVRKYNNRRALVIGIRRRRVEIPCRMQNHGFILNV
jgi:hypothetical protein